MHLQKALRAWSKLKCRALPFHTYSHRESATHPMSSTIFDTAKKEYFYVQ